MKKRAATHPTGDFPAGAQRRRELFLQPIHAARDAALEDLFTKVEKIPELQAGQPKVSLDLFPVHGQDPLDGFELQKHLVFDKDVGAESFLKQDPFVGDRPLALPFHLQPALGQFPSQNDLVNRLQQPRPKFAMNVDGRLDHSRSKIVFLHLKKSLCNSAPLRESVFPDIHSSPGEMEQ